MEDTTRGELTVGLIADPGLPLERARELRTWLPDRLSSTVADVPWDVQVERLSLPLDEEGGVKLNANAGMLRNQREWDYLVYLTDLPKYIEGEPLLATVNTDYGAAMVVLPALGIIRRKGLRQQVLEAVDALHAAGVEQRNFGPAASPINRLFSRDVAVGEAGTTNDFETVSGWPGRLLLQAGLVRSNRPWRLVPQLSSSMAAAAATGAFGVFYTSIWSMADYLSPLRLASISLLSIAVMSLWLILANGLWERPQAGPRPRERKLTYNTATTATIVIAVAVMYVVLFCLILGGSLIIIAEDYISDVLGHAASFGEYINLAWLSASLGTLAGAVGSSFDDEQSVRQATFSSREYERRQITLEPDDEVKPTEPSGS